MLNVTATILPSSTTFHAVGYNEHKVLRGHARLMALENFGHIGQLWPYTSQELIDYLTVYSSRNPRIKGTQFHVAISCRGHEWSEDALLDFARLYLKEMGYGEDGQPLLAYAHSDTANTHIHIITSRVAPDGHKINDSNERRRSREAINRLLGHDIKAKLEADMIVASQYRISSLAQYKSVLCSMGYECYDRKGVLSIKRDGKVQHRIKLSELAHLFKKQRRDYRYNSQLRAIFRKYRDICTSKEELRTELKKKFGIDLVFLGPKDRPYGYMIVDHAGKRVTNGLSVMPLEELLDFATPKERMDLIDTFIDSLLDTNPKASIADVNAKIKKYRARISKGELHYGDHVRKIQPIIWATLQRNNRIAWAEAFRPTTESERELIAEIAKVTTPDMIDLADNPLSADATHALLHSALDDKNKRNAEIRRDLRENKIFIKERSGIFYAIDFEHKRIVNLNESGYDISRLQAHRRHVRRGKNILAPIARKLHGPQAQPTSGQNREHEVGTHRRYDDIDDHINSGLTM